MSAQGVAEIESIFQREVGELLPDVRDQMVDEFNKMVGNFNDAWWHQGLAVRWMMKRAIEQIRGDLERLLPAIDHALDHYVPVLSLFRASIRWTDDVMTPVSDIYGSIPPGTGNRNLGYWDDQARSAYNDIVGEQRAATGAARDLAAFMSRWLSEIGQANTTFATHLVEVVGKIVGKLASAAAAAASVIGSPFALQDLAGMIGAAVEGLFATLAKITNDVVGAVDRVINAENEFSDHSHFPGGEWPIAVRRA